MRLSSAMVCRLPQASRNVIASYCWARAGRGRVNPARAKPYQTGYPGRRQLAARTGAGGNPECSPRDRLGSILPGLLARLAKWSRPINSNRSYEFEHIPEPGLGILRFPPVAPEILDQFALLRGIE